MSRDPAIHATCVTVGETGILIRGPAGAGKSTLARRLVAAALGQGRFARWVADDRVRLAAAHGRLVARAHPAVAGLAEMRGEGVVAVAHEQAARIGLVVDLDAAADRVPAEADRVAVLAGVACPRLAAATPDAALDAALRRLGLAGGPGAAPLPAPAK